MGFLGLGIHAYMLADQARNNALARSIRCAVRPGDVVADVGGGTGLLSVLAARAGAARVYCIEASALAGLARRVVRDNGLEDRIEVLAGVAQTTQLPERCDVVISETLGFLALDEGFRAVMTSARDRFLRPGGRLLPASVSLKVAAVEVSKSLPDVWCAPGVDEVDLSCVIRTFSMVPRRAHVDPALQLSAAETLVDLNCMTMGAQGDLDFSCRVTCRREGRLAGFIVWFDARLIDGIELSSRSPDSRNHWGQGFLAAPEGEVVRRGDVISLTGTITDKPGGFRMSWSCRNSLADTAVSA